MIFRFARHTNNLESIREFFTKILGLDFLGEFNNHHGYDGIFLGEKESGWHLEFTKSDNLGQYKYNEDDILVFYPSTNEEYKKIINQLEEFQINKITPKNPYWQVNGIMFLDPDGYRIVISSLRIK